MGNNDVKALKIIFCFALIVACGNAPEEQNVSSAPPSRARWHNNQGVVYMDQHNYTRGRNEFEKGIALAPDYAAAHANLGIALYSLGKYDSAAVALQTALAHDENLLQAHFTLGLIYNAQGKEQENALASLGKVAIADPDDPHVRYYIGQVRAKLGQNEMAVDDFLEAIRLDPYNVSAYYGQANAYRRLGKTEEWRAALEKFNELSQAGHQGVSSSYQGQGRYAEVVSDASGANASLDDRSGPFAFAPAQTIISSPTVATLLDYDGDGGTDVLSGPPLSLFGGGITNTDITLPTAAEPTHALVVDLNNDDLPDLVLSGAQTAIMLGQKAGHWTPLAPLPAASAAVAADVDHDGDLDLLLTSARGRHLLANDGQASFSDITIAAGLPADQPASQAVFTDFDNDRDIDIFVVAPSGLQLYSNNRDGTFTDIAAQLGFGDLQVTAILVEDFNQDSYMDAALLSPKGELSIWHNERGLLFSKGALLDVANTSTLLSSDVDNDGDLDAWALGSNGATLLAWHEDSFQASAAPIQGQTTLPALSADFDGDGRTDLWAAGKLFKNETNAGNWVRIALQGLNSNHDGIGTKVEIKTENRLQKRELRGNGNLASELTFGLAEGDSLEFVRILWPGGVRQTELATGAGQRLELKELDRKGTSCPILYAWDGERYRFVTDILGGAIIGYLTAPGQYYYPDSDEYVPLGKIAPRDGHFSLKLTNQLEEIIYIDALELVAIDHPKDVDVYPNERLLSAPPYPEFSLYPLTDLRPPRAAQDHEGRNVLKALSKVDDIWYEGFARTDIHGYAEEFSLTLDLGDLAGVEHPVLLAYGWVDYAHSSSNWAAVQRGLNLSPPRLEVADGQGGWQLFSADMGHPAGLPKHMLFDLQDAFKNGDYRIRITTNAAIYWDQFLVGAAQEVPLHVHRSKPATADLRWRGYPAHTSIKGTFAFRYDYDQLHLEAPWGTHGGSYTRLGPVDELVGSTDDRFAIMFHGDELSIEFAADSFPPPIPGMQRSYMLYADGFGKDMDFHSAHSLTVAPLPFHGMSSYPYPASERYPQTEAHVEYLEEYNTRHVRGYYQ
ncbi:MAG: FG-GAP-like repeat-containing protein [Candidatus Latescibacterota bacterium]|jgi:Flp pilus assembly protein TadD